MHTTETPEAIARDLIAEMGRQGALDFLIDELIDTDDETKAEAAGVLIEAVERATAH